MRASFFSWMAVFISSFHQGTLGFVFCFIWLPINLFAALVIMWVNVSAVSIVFCSWLFGSSFVCLSTIFQMRASLVFLNSIFCFCFCL